MTSFRVKALFAYSSEHDDDLSFGEGQIITITEDDDDDWYTGEYTDEATGAHHQGLFPRNFVERYEPVAPPRPVRRPQAAAPVPVPVTAAEPGEEEEEEELKPAQVTAQTSTTATHAQRELKEEEEDEDEQEEEEPEAPPPPPVLSTKPAPPPTQEIREPPAQASKPMPPPPAPEVARSPPLAQVDASNKPVVAEKPSGSSFRDRIAAFNKGSAAPVAPPKPGGLGGGSSGSSGFIKKSYVAPPPSRNAYVAPATQAPVAKIYRREEDPEFKSQDEESRPAPPVEQPVDSEEPEAKPMSLKERMALLQKQQLEQQARQADAAAKKSKPKPPPKKASNSSQPPPVPEGIAGDSEEVNVPTKVLSNESVRTEPITGLESEEPESIASRDGAPVEPLRVPHPPVREVEEAEEEEKEDPEETKAENEGEEVAEQEEEEDEVDPEIRRRMEIRERMAKMSGGMGMGAMFGSAPGLPGMGAKKSSKARTTSTATENSADSVPVQAVPIMPAMALPGMGPPVPKRLEEAVEEPEVSKEDELEETEPISARAPEEVPDVEDLKQAHGQGVPEREPSKVIPPPAETRPAPPIPPTAERTQRPSVASAEAGPVERGAPPIPQRVPEAKEVRAAPPPPPPQVASPPLPPTSPPRPSESEKRSSRVPPIPGGVDVGAAFGRAPPPPPPSQPPRQSMEATRRDESEEEEEEEDDEEPSEDEEPQGRRSEDLHHDGLPSLGPGAQMRAPPPPPPNQASAPRGVPPPPPSQPPRQSRELPRAPPPVPSVAKSPSADDDYDPFNYQSNPLGAPAGSSTTTPRIELQNDDLYEATPPTSPGSRAPPPVPQHQAPPPQAVPNIPLPSQAPPSQAAPPPPPPQAPPAQKAPQLPPQSPPSASPVVPQESRKSLDILGRTNTRRSVDVPRPSGEHHDYIASDVDLGRESNWWAQRRSPPPVFQNRGDICIEYDESTTVQNDGQALTAKHVYVLFMDYSQTIVTAYYAQDNPTGGAEFQQRHEPPPAKLRQDQLEAAHARFGAKLAQTAKGKENHAVADGSSLAFVSELIRGLPDALAPVGSRAFGATVYSNMANATVQQYDEIRAGDVLSFRNAKLQGHRGGLKQKYSLDLTSHIGFVVDWDGTKQKVRIYEQNGKKVKVESYKLGDLKTGEAKIWRVMSREWVGWGSTS